MAKIFEFRPKPSGRPVIDEVDEKRPQDIGDVMNELLERFRNSRTMEEDRPEYAEMASRVTDLLGMISEKYQVSPRNFIVDILYLQAGKEIFNNIMQA